MRSIDLKADPSEILQSFNEVDIKIHCCRYWRLKLWNTNNMAYPFWRIYYNSLPGAMIFFKKKEIQLDSERVILIPPNTSFSTRFGLINEKEPEEAIQGRRIQHFNEVETLKKRGEVDHLFIHFNFGSYNNYLIPDVYQFKLNQQVFENLSAIKSSFLKNFEAFDLKTTAIIKSLIFYLVSQLDPNLWQRRITDLRILEVMRFIDNNISFQLSNNDCAEKVLMAPNSLLRLFKLHVGESLHQYIQNRRIEYALLLIHHSNKTIKQIADECGFCDRHHFSKAFKKNMNMSPAIYRRHITMR